jgi:hypothetical protein
MRHRLLSAVGALAFVAAPLYAQTAPNLVPGTPNLLHGTRTGVLSTIAGKAVNSVNVPAGNTLIRLRDVRSGHVVATTITDKAGQFEFRAVDTGSYIAEMMSSSGEIVLASSSILYVGSGEILSTLLKVPLSTPAIGTLLFDSVPAALSAVTSAAQVITAVAGSTNTPAQTPVGEPATAQNPAALRSLR